MTNLIQNVQIGTRVRSFDFAMGEFGRDLTGDRASYVDGTVVAIGDFLGNGYDQYKIRPDRQIAGGKCISHNMADHYYPPVNGTPSLMEDDGTNYVERI